jgi:hypothetical protein
MICVRRAVFWGTVFASLFACRNREAPARLPDGGLKTLTIEELSQIGRVRRVGAENARGDSSRPSHADARARGIAPERPSSQRADAGDAGDADGGEAGLNFNYRMVPAMLFDDGCGPTSKRCTIVGLCGERDGGACVAVAAADCRRSLYCRTSGHCGLKGDACVATNDADCRASTGCRYRGACTVSGSECVASTSADCRASLWCQKNGLCSARNNRCVAGSSGYCRASTQCKEVGACTAEGGICIISGDADCRASVGCRKLGHCRFDGARRVCER